MHFPPTRRSAAAALAAAALLLAGCAHDEAHSSGKATVEDPSSRPTTTSQTTATSQTPATRSANDAVALAAAVAGREIDVYDIPGGRVLATLRNPIPSGARLTFLVLARKGSWVEVQLARRPNGSRGWVEVDGVRLQSLTYSLHVSTAENTLTLSRAGIRVRTFPVATGTGGTPTPHGTFYLTELLAPRNAGYGPYAFGVSAFSTVLNSFGGGPGQIGLHGTDDTGSIGTAVSHGCIRMRNKDITTLAGILPLGTPITID